MDTTTLSAFSVESFIAGTGPRFRDRATQHDRSGDFVADNYRDLKDHRLFAALVPEELGGLGLTHATVCDLLRQIAHYCPSTALAQSMHQHLVSAAVWKYRHRGQAEALLRRVAAEQLVLVSTGARDWLGSSGEAVKVSGGYLVSARKPFASQSAIGDLALTSAPFQNEAGEWKVLHFPVSLKAAGVSLRNDWDVMGMRGTGSQCIVFDNVFVPDSAIDLERPRHQYHPVWNLVLTVAMPLIMAVYLGIAERAYELALEETRRKEEPGDADACQLARLYNSLLSARTQWKAMVSLCRDFDFPLDEDHTVDMLSLKTNVCKASNEVVAGSFALAGGRAFYRQHEMERLFRDVQAGNFHPLPEWEQYAFTGGKILDANKQ